MRKTQGTPVKQAALPARAAWTLTENGELILALVLAFFLTAALRLIEYGQWQVDAFWIGSEPLMATHDAYAWLAGAKGVGNYVQAPFTAIVRGLHQLTGLSLGVIGFWLPVWMTPLIAVPACLLARALRLPEAGLVFGVLSASSIGFLTRSRLGFCDTDLVALVFPLAFVTGLIVWLMTQTRATWRAGGETEPVSPQKTLVYLLLTGLSGALSMFTYSQSSTILLAVLGLALGLGLVLAPRAHWPEIWVGLLVIYALTYGGLPGLGLGLALAAASYKWPDFWQQRHGLLLLGLIAIFLFAYAGLAQKILSVWTNIVGYAKPVTDLGNTTVALQLPGITQSVREAQDLPWGQMATRVAGYPWLFGLGILSYAWAVFRRPHLVVLLPLLGLSMASVKLGNRFTMYGGIPLGAGLGFGLAEVLRYLNQSQGRRWIAQLALCVLVFWPMASLMNNVFPTPVLPNVYAQAFVDLREKTPAEARLWQWWDYGYAGQYYAERLTFGDGGIHDGPWLYPLALVHCTPSALQASQLMHFITRAQRQTAQEAMFLAQNKTTLGQAELGSQTPEIALEPKEYYWASPVAQLEAMGPFNATAFMASLAQEEQAWALDLPAQYLVLSWENLRLAYWISFYGNWDLATGTGAPGQCQQLQGQFGVNSQNGYVNLNGQALPIDSLDIVGEGSTTQRLTWPNGSGQHALINQRSNQAFLMNSKIYHSLMVQMLIGNPQDFAPHFELVDDLYPWVRVYKAS